VIEAKKNSENYTIFTDFRRQMLKIKLKLYLKNRKMTSKSSRRPKKKKKKLARFFKYIIVPDGKPPFSASIPP